MAKGKKGNNNAQQPANQDKKGQQAQQAQPSQAQIDKNK
jgi:hypothetical protein